MYTASSKISRIRTTAIRFFVFFLINSFVNVTAVFGADVTVEWIANTETDLAGYKVYYGTSSGNYGPGEDVGKTTQKIVTELVEGQTYYFAVTAYDLSNNESAFSEEHELTISAANQAPYTPVDPNGSANGEVATAYTFSTSSSDPEGDAVSYQFDWGDGSTSSWGSGSQSHTWSSAGNYCVKAQAKDAAGAESAWSGCSYIDIINQVRTITASVGANGTINPSGATAVFHGDDQTFIITPNTHYHVADVKVDNASVGAQTTYTFNNVTADHTISATFAIDTFTITASASPHGSISPEGTATVNHGSSHVYTFAPVTGYKVNDVVVDGASKGASSSYTLSNIDRNHTISVSFKKLNLPPTANAGPNKVKKRKELVQLSGAASSDPDDGIATYAWTQTVGTSVTLSTPNAVDTSFVAPDGTGTESLTFQLVVTDGNGDQDTDTCVIQITDIADADSDGDGIIDIEDNCPSDSNADQIDNDADGAGDVCDTDDDNDGISDSDETGVYGTDPLMADTDGDGLLDGAEVALWGTAWKDDIDGDGKNNLLDSDADGDGMLDGMEVEIGKNPGEQDQQAQEGVVPQSEMTILAVTSEEVQSGYYAAENSLDGRADTFWHTSHIETMDETMSAHNHNITIDLGKFYVLGGLRYLPRQDGFNEGNIAQYKVLVSRDGVNWGDPVAEGSFSADSTEKEAFIYDTLGRYLKLEAVSEVNGLACACAAEINVLGVEPETIVDKDGDGLIDVDESNVFKTNPDVADTDQDQMTDAEELMYWKSLWNGDIDDDGIINLLDEDSDGDTYLDGYEKIKGYDPGDATSHPTGLDDDITLGQLREELAAAGCFITSADSQKSLSSESTPNMLILLLAVVSGIVGIIRSIYEKRNSNY